MKRITTILCFGLLALLLTGAALDKYNVTVNGTGALLPPYTNFFDINRAHGSNAFSQTFGSSNALYLLTARVNTESNRINALETADTLLATKAALNTESNRINSLNAVTQALGTAAFTASTAYATAAQGAKADAAIQGIIVTGNATGETNGNTVTVNVTGGGGGSSPITVITPTLGMSSNTVSESSIFSGVITNNTLTNGRTLKVVAYGIYTNATAGVVSITLKVKIGGVEVYSDAAGTVAQSSTPRNWRIELFVRGFGDASQFTSGTFQLSPNSTADTGLGDAAGTTYLKNALISSLDNSTVDMTSGDKTFDVTITQGTASTSAVWVTKTVAMEIQ